MAVALVDHALCSISDVKLRMPSETSDQSDSLIANLINSFSTFAENRCQRKFLVTSRTEYFGGYGSSGTPLTEIQLPAYPIDTSATIYVYEDTNRTFAASSLLTENTNYVVDYASGVVRRMPLQQLVPYGDPYGVYWLGNTRTYPRGAMNDCYWAYGDRTVKIIWTGGLVTKRTAAPATGSAASNGSGALDGSFRYAHATIDSNGYESVASVEVPISVADKTIRYSFSAPGAGNTTRIYRSETNENILYHVADVAGTATFYDDNIADGSLNRSIVPYGAGPRVVPEDLREACATQVMDWFQRRDMPGIVRVSQQAGGVSGGAATFLTRDKVPLLPYVAQVLDTYTP